MKRPTKPKAVPRTPIGAERRLSILCRDDLTCLFCGDRPGRDGLNVAHIIPHSKGGSDHDNNLVTACIPCNAKAGSRVAVPPRYATGEIDSQGWHIWRRWGAWVLHWLPDPPSPADVTSPLVDATCDVALTFQPLDYWIALQRVHEPDWASHLRRKPWMTRDRDYEDRKYTPENWPNFLTGLEFVRTLIRPHPRGRR